MFCPDLGLILTNINVLLIPMEINKVNNELVLQLF